VECGSNLAPIVLTHHINNKKLRLKNKRPGQFTGRNKRETHGIRPMRTEMSEMYEVARIDKTLPPCVGRLQKDEGMY
jgi:hypothetical protein